MGRQLRGESRPLVSAKRPQRGDTQAPWGLPNGLPSDMSDRFPSFEDTELRPAVNIILLKALFFVQRCAGCSQGLLGPPPASPVTDEPAGLRKLLGALHAGAHTRARARTRPGRLAPRAAPHSTAASAPGGPPCAFRPLPALGHLPGSRSGPARAAISSPGPRGSLPLLSVCKWPVPGTARPSEGTAPCLAGSQRAARAASGPSFTFQKPSSWGPCPACSGWPWAGEGDP